MVFRLTHKKNHVATYKMENNGGLTGELRLVVLQGEINNCPLDV